MANTCLYTIKAVSKNEDAIKRLIQIMNYKDPEYFIYRCRSVYDNGIYKDGDYYVADLNGDVAWSCNRWFATQENKDELVVIKYDDDFNPTYGTAHYISLDLLCKKLGVAIELYSEESGCCFQEHYQVNANGEIVCSECVEWTEDWWDEENDCERDEPITTGGFEYYCQFGYPDEIYA